MNKREIIYKIRNHFTDPWRTKKLTWNYRIVKCVTEDGNGKSHTWYGMFEVYNNKEGLPYTRTADPISFVGDEGSEVIEAIGMAFQDALKYDILDDDDIKDENEDDYYDEGCDETI